MQAAVIAPNGVEVGDAPKPVPGSSQVLVRVRQTAGGYRPPALV